MDNEVDASIELFDRLLTENSELMEELNEIEEKKNKTKAQKKRME